MDNNFEVQISYREITPDLNGQCFEYSEDTTVIEDYWPTGVCRYYISTIDSTIQIAYDSNKNILNFILGDTIDANNLWINDQFLDLLSIFYFLPDSDTTGYWPLEISQYLGYRIIQTDTVYGWMRLKLGNELEIEETYFDLKE